MSSTIQWPVSAIRRTFVEFFQTQMHQYIASSPSIPQNDPTLLFTNAGMNQFKDIFTGQVDASSERGKIRRVVNSQKCIRAGGKHNDLEDVGRDTYHHTFFEMLGNWSFGDYFKSEMIPMAWKLLTEVYGLPKEQLYVTYFEGNESLGLAPDIEARDIWLKFLPQERIIKGNMKDNFWEMGETGPCGPCTEIHFDRLGNRNAAHLVNKDDPMVLEIWNIVFIQFCRQPDKSLLVLPARHIDTGMGLERLTSILQNVHSNYDTDIWSNLFAKIKEVTSCPWNYTDKEISEDVIVAYRVIADHIRMITVSIVDGAVPDNAGRGYVLRRVIRRAIRFGNEFMGAKVGFFSQLVETVCSELGDFFPEMLDAKNIARAKALIYDEEKTFAKTWNSGLEHFKNLRLENSMISGDDAFILHDRYGFPIDLTCLMAQRNGTQVNMDEFQKAMENHQKAAGEKAKAATSFLDGFALDHLRKDGVRTTDDAYKYNWDISQEAKILRLFNSNSNQFVDSADSGCVGVITDVTSFYAEAGGQIYDIGVIETSSGTVSVEKVYNYGGYICHIGRITRGKVLVGESVTLSVDYQRRLLVGSNHTITHFLNHALRQCLATENAYIEVNQKGSYVCDEFFRFDFSWSQKLDTASLKAIETMMLNGIQSDLKVFWKTIPLKEALEIKSLRCMFDEKYGENVTVVSIGKSVEDILTAPTDDSLVNYSIELCGGTHISSLKKAVDVAIIGEDALTKGVRRMTVVTGPKATKAKEIGKSLQEELVQLTESHIEDYDERLKAISIHGKKVNESDAPLLIKIQLREDSQELYKKVNALKKDYETATQKQAAELGTKLAQELCADSKFYIVQLQKELKNQSRMAIQNLVDAFHKTKNIPLYVVGVDKGTPLIIAASNNSKCNAADWIKASVGRGGGKPNLAQAGCSLEDLQSVLDKAHSFVHALDL